MSVIAHLQLLTQLKKKKLFDLVGTTRRIDGEMFLEHFQTRKLVFDEYLEFTRESNREVNWSDLTAVRTVESLFSYLAYRILCMIIPVVIICLNPGLRFNTRVFKFLLSQPFTKPIKLLLFLPLYKKYPLL